MLQAVTQLHNLNNLKNEEYPSFWVRRLCAVLTGASDFLIFMYSGFGRSKGKQLEYYPSLEDGLLV